MDGGSQLSLNHLSLFSGIGGFDIAAERAGFTTVAFVEKEPFCQRILARHWPGVPIFGDICTVGVTDLRGLGRIDIVTGGPPCPEFSQANKYAKGFDSKRGQLVFEYLRIAKASGASWLVLENAARIVTRFRDGFVSAFDEAGYSAIPLCFGGHSFHARKRGFFIANTDEVGGVSQLHSIAAMVRDANRERKAQKPTGVEFILRTDADPVFMAESEGSRLVAPVFCREDDGVPNRVDRVGALGNAIHPDHAFPILEAIHRVCLTNAMAVAS